MLRASQSPTPHSTTHSRRLHRQPAHTHVPLPQPTAKDDRPHTTSPTPVAQARHQPPRHSPRASCFLDDRRADLRGLARSTADLDRLTPEQRRLFRRVVARAFIPDLRTGRFRGGLSVRGVPGVLELTQAEMKGSAVTSWRLNLGHLLWWI